MLMLSSNSVKHRQETERIRVRREEGAGNPNSSSHIIMGRSTSTMTTLLVHCLILLSSCWAFVPSIGAKPSRQTTALAAHNRLQQALALLGGLGRSPFTRGPTSSNTYNNKKPASGEEPYAPQPPALGVLSASYPDAPGKEASTEKIKVTAHRQSSGPAAVTDYLELTLPTNKGISLHDITPSIREAITEAGVEEGWVNVVSRHTTTAVILNECESRLMDDVRQFLLKLAPADYPYLHNDIHLRPYTEEDKRRIGDDWDLDEWRAQEPLNCHSHLLSMLLGNTLMLPVTRGELAIGRWQSVMMVELDGPRDRTVGVQVSGFKNAYAQKPSSQLHIPI